MKDIQIIRQFYDEGIEHVEYDSGEPFEGFDHSGVLPLGELLKRLERGQDVYQISDGVGFEDQVFDDQMMEEFDVIDHSNSMVSGFSKKKGKPSAETKPEDVGSSDNLSSEGSKQS